MKGETNYEGAKGRVAKGMVSSPISSKMNLFVSPVKGGHRCEMLQLAFTEENGILANFS